MNASRLMSSFAFFAVGSIALGACTVATEDTSEIESPDKIKPVDSETLGTLLVHRPPAGSVMSFVVRVDGEVVAPETATRVVEGTHVLELAYEGDDWKGLAQPKSVYRRIEVKRKQQTRVDLSAMTFGYSASDLAEGDLNVLTPTSFKLIVDNKPFPHDCATRRWKCTSGNYDCVQWTPTGCWDWTIHSYSIKSWHDTKDDCQAACGNNSIYGPRNATCTQPEDKVCDQDDMATLVDTSDLRGVWSGSSSSSLALLEGSYTVTTSSGTVGVSLSPGAFQVVSQGSSSAARGDLVVTPPSDRELPNARPDELLLTLDGSGRNKMVVDTRSAYTVKAVGFDNVAETNLTATLGPRSMRIALRDGQAASLNLGRIDVDDVLVTRENGTTYEARGRYTVTCITDGTDVGSFSTKTGLDVLPGDYRVDLTYSTEEGPKSQTFRLHF